MKAAIGNKLVAEKVEDAKQINSEKYTPRFNFGINIDHEGKQTATIKDLLEELTYENVSKFSGNKLDITYLKTVLRFFRDISGQALKSTTEKHPVADLKTIKMIFDYNRYSDAHLIGFLEPPGESSQSIIDVLTSPTTEDNEKLLKTIDRMIGDLAKEIDPEELRQIDDVCSQINFREAHHKNTNEAIDKIILTHININEDLLKEADDYLAEKTRDFHRSIIPIKKESRIHVATYTYLKILDYVHRLHFDISTQLTIPNDKGVANKQINFDSICKSLSDSLGRQILKDTNFMSIDEVSGFVEDYASDIAKIVSSSTGFQYNKRDVLNDKNRAIVIEVIYLARADLPNEKNMKPIGVVHVIAAFCSILHQRKMKSKIGKKSRKYSLKKSAPQKLLDEYMSNPKQGLPPSVQYIYTERVFWYGSAFLGRKDKYDSSKSLNITQSEIYRDVYMSLDHKKIKEKLDEYRAYMVDAANKFVDFHNRKDTNYEWTYGN